MLCGCHSTNNLSDAETLDPVCSIPGYKVIGVKVEKVSGGESKKLTEEVDNEEVAYYENEDPSRIRYKEAAAEKLLAGKGE